MIETHCNYSRMLSIIILICIEKNGVFICVCINNNNQKM